MSGSCSFPVSLGRAPVLDGLGTKTHAVMKGVKTNSSEASAPPRGAESSRSRRLNQCWRSLPYDRPFWASLRAVDTSVTSLRSRNSLAASSSDLVLIRRA